MKELSLHLADDMQERVTITVPRPCYEYEEIPITKAEFVNAHYLLLSQSLAVSYGFRFSGMRL